MQRTKEVFSDILVDDWDGFGGELRLVIRNGDKDGAIWVEDKVEGAAFFADAHKLGAKIIGENGFFDVRVATVNLVDAVEVLWVVFFAELANEAEVFFDESELYRNSAVGVGEETVTNEEVADVLVAVFGVGNGELDPRYVNGITVVAALDALAAFVAVEAGVVEFVGTDDGLWHAFLWLIADLVPEDGRYLF